MFMVPMTGVLGGAVDGVVLVVSGVPTGNPGVTPNSTGLPGLGVLRSMVGALLTWGLLACVAGLVVSVIVWALGHQSGNYSHTSNGKTGVLVASGGAILIGGANAIVTFFSNLGSSI
jgi:Family of unknown function (DUF6112)